MNDNNKGPDRLNITKKAKKIVEKIDNEKYLNLEFPTTTRSELFSLAMAIGIEAMPTKLSNIYPGGFILDSSIDSRTRALMYAYNISTLPDEDMLDSITDKVQIFSIAEEYANTGFEVIEDYINNYKPTDVLLDLLLEIDKQYNELSIK